MAADSGFMDHLRNVARGFEPPTPTPTATETADGVGGTEVEDGVQGGLALVVCQYCYCLTLTALADRHRAACDRARESAEL